jgi:hypothetical protein
VEVHPPEGEQILKRNPHWPFYTRFLAPPQKSMSKMALTLVERCDCLESKPAARKSSGERLNRKKQQTGEK